MKHSVFTCDVCGDRFEDAKPYEVHLVFNGCSSVRWDVCSNCWGEANNYVPGARMSLLKTLRGVLRPRAKSATGGK
jgi:hypothetical protein